MIKGISPMKFWRGFAAAGAALALSVVTANAQSLPFLLPAYSVAAAPYQGPKDIVSGATFCGSLRACSGAIVTAGTQLLVNVRRASDNATADIQVASNGGLGVTQNASAGSNNVSPAVWAGTDATATCSTSGSSVTLSCTSASSTPNASDPISGTGIAAGVYIVSCGTFTGGAGSCTMNIAQTVSSTTVTFQVALFVKILYDQITGTNNPTQTTGSAQPQLFLTGGPTSALPFMAFSLANSTTLAINGGTTVSPTSTMSVVGNSTSPDDGFFVFLAGSANVQLRPNGTSSGTAQAYNGTVLNFTLLNSAWHNIVAVFNGASSDIDVDGTHTTGATGAGSTTSTANLTIGSGNATGYTAQMSEVVIWDNLPFTTGQQANLTANMAAYW